MARETKPERNLRESQAELQQSQEAFLAEIKRTGVISEQWKGYLITMMQSIALAAMHVGRDKALIPSKPMKIQGKKK